MSGLYKNIYGTHYPLFLIGAPPEEFLNQQVTAHDHPFLRANLPAMNAYRALEQGKNTLDGLIGEYEQAEMGKELSTRTHDAD